MLFTPRQWQSDCLERFQQKRQEGKPSFVFEACMGAGKSAVAAMMAKQLLNDNVIEHALVLVPWKSIQGDVEKGMLAAFGRAMGLDARDRFFTGTKRQPFQKPPQMDATVTLYQEVCNQEAIELIRFWKKEWDFRFALFCDEIHHTNEINSSWGVHVEQLRELATVSVFMSGTYFRGDKKPIGCIDLDEEGKPLKDYSYIYKQAVADCVVRPVTTRHIDAMVSMYDKTADRQYDVRLSEISGKELSAAKKQVLDPDGECMRHMIQSVHESLMRTRIKFPDAACLFVCRPGHSDDYSDGNAAIEDRHVYRVAKQIKALTGEQPTVVTHHDKDSIGKLSMFRRSASPYLVAINMVSEGCDIPRLRSVAFCRYTTSEMLFRQIAGRALRLHTENGAIEDHTQAAQIYIPAFPLLVEFASRLWGEADEGIQARLCEKCVEYPCQCPCKKCGEPRPCHCEGIGCGNWEPTIFGLDATPIWNGGHMADDYVSEFYVQAAQNVISSTDGHRHENAVQLGHAFQHFHRCCLHSPVESPRAQEAAQETRDNLKRKINRDVRWLAIRLYDKQYDKAYYEEIQRAFGDSWKSISNTWSVDKLQKIYDRLENRIMETHRHG